MVCVSMTSDALPGSGPLLALMTAARDISLDFTAGAREAVVPAAVPPVPWTAANRPPAARTAAPAAVAPRSARPRRCRCRARSPIASMSGVKG